LESDEFGPGKCSVYRQYVCNIVVKDSRSLSHLLMSFLLRYATDKQTNKQTQRHADQRTINSGKVTN